MKKINKFTTIALSVCIVTLSAHGFSGGWGYLNSENQPHAGIKAGQIKYIKDDNSIVGIDMGQGVRVDIDNANAYGAYAGYTFDSGFGFEADYMESDKAKVTLTPEEIDEIQSIVRGDLKIKSLGLAATYKHNFSNSGNVYVKGKLGGVVHDTELTMPDYSESKVSTDWMAGAGIGVNTSRNTSVELNYTRVGDSMDSLMLSAHARF